MTQTTSLVEMKNEIAKELKDPGVVQTLLATTFKGLSAGIIPQVILEGRIRNYTFRDFLEKNIYAIPFRDGYSLVTSIDHARKVGMRSNVVGKSAPTYETDAEGKVVSCSVTIKRLVGNTVGEFTATVYFDEYYKKGKEIKGVYYPTLWDTKPRTMIAKVAEMHALRMACPEEMAQVYVEEELEKENKVIDQTEEALPEFVFTTIEDTKERILAAKNKEEILHIWASLPGPARKELWDFKNEIKTKYENS